MRRKTGLILPLDRGSPGRSNRHEGILVLVFVWAAFLLDICRRWHKEKQTGSYLGCCFKNWASFFLVIFIIVFHVGHTHNWRPNYKCFLQYAWGPGVCQSNDGNRRPPNTWQLCTQSYEWPDIIKSGNGAKYTLKGRQQDTQVSVQWICYKKLYKFMRH